jgi:hypothetical protein
VLVTAGLDSELSWSTRGVDTGDSLAVYPAVVLAFRPELGRTDFGKFSTRRGRVLDPTLVWYRWLGPPEHAAALDNPLPLLRLPGGNWDIREHTLVEFRPGADSELRPPPQLSFVVDAAGREVDRIVSDPYWRWERSGRLPPASVYALLDFAELPYR